MQCFVLGTGGMMPMPGRPLTSVVVRPSSRMYQFDAGEGVQVGVKQLRIGVKQLGVVAITHLHADHCLGLPGMLMLRAQVEDPGPLVLLGPPGLGTFVRNVLRDLACHIGYPIEIREWSRDGKDIAYADSEVTIRWAPLRHGVLCLGYRLEEHQRPGRFDPDAARALGVPRGPLWGRLQRGEQVRVEGRVVDPSQVLGPPRRGRVVAFCTDTAPCDEVIRLCREADLAFVESMFIEADAHQGRQKLHLTAKQAADLTLRARAHRVMLVHTSPRYGRAELSRMIREAQSVNPATHLAETLQRIDIPLPD